MTTIVRAATESESAKMLKMTYPTPLLFAGCVIRCTNAHAREFTNNLTYRVERMVSPARPGPALAVVRNDNGEERVIPSLAWGLGHWSKHPVGHQLQNAVVLAT